MKLSNQLTILRRKYFMHLTDSVYWYPWEGMGNNCNTYLITGEKNVLVDPGHVRNEMGERCLDKLQNRMQADGFDLEDISLVLCTHSHPDHCEAAGTIAQMNNARVAMHYEEENIMEAISRMFRTQPIEPDFLLQEGELEVGEKDKRVFQVIHTPGHSPGSVSFFLPEEGALISGDAVFRGSIGRTDLPGGDIKALGRSIDKMTQLQGVRWLLPGHMDLVEGEVNVNRNLSTIKHFFF